jgi:hypothetical protein
MYCLAWTHRHTDQDVSSRQDITGGLTEYCRKQHAVEISCVLQIQVLIINMARGSCLFKSLLQNAQGKGTYQGFVMYVFAEDL